MLPRLTEDVTLCADKALYCTLKFKMLKINLFYLIEFCSQIYVSIILYYLLFVKSFFTFFIFILLALHIQQDKHGSQHLLRFAWCTKQVDSEE